MIPWDRKIYPNLCEGVLQLAVADYVQWWRCFVVPNLCLFHEMDVAVLTRAGCLWEFEIKVTQRDWESDHRKDEASEWRGPTRRLKHVERFYYVVAPKLKIPDWIPDWAGVLEARISTWGSATQEYIGLSPVRRAKARRAEKPSDAHLIAIYTAAHRRFWDRLMRLPVPERVAALGDALAG